MTQSEKVHQSAPAPAIEIAGALQAVYAHLPQRDYIPDIHQEAAINAIGWSLASGNTSGYIEMATSSGKTLVESLLAEAAVRAGKRALVLAPTRNIADQ